MIDKVKIKIKAGNGGSGKVSFRRDGMNALGGPDGGDGGNGGSIIFVADKNLNTLQNFEFVKKFEATNGLAGGSNHCKGKDGIDKIIYVPIGTVIKDNSTHKVLCDLYEDGQTYLALKGGRGGKGNSFFKTPTRRAPSFSQLGEECDWYTVELELKLIADVALVGKPNVGKSTFLSVISNAKPKIANYEFTTLEPNLGVVKMYGDSFVVADIPGLIEGASLGAGLGHEFLAHIERTRLVLHIIDGSSYYGNDPKEDYLLICEELKKYNKSLAKRPQIVVLTKMDLVDDVQSVIDDLKTVVNGDIFAISSITKMNVENLLNEVYNRLKKLPKRKPIKVEQTALKIEDNSSLDITKDDDGVYVVTGGYIKNLQRGIVFSDPQSLSYFQYKLEADGVMDKLKKAGVKPGDTLKFGDLQFEYYE